MKDRDIVSAFDALTSDVDGNRTAHMVRMNIKASEKQQRVHFSRTAITAVCIVLTSVLSVGAYAIYQSLSVQIPDSGPFDYIAQVNNASEMLTLSDAVMAELENYRFDASSGKSMYESGKMFDSWEEAALWLECGLLTSNKLGDIPKTTVWGGEIVLVSFYSSGGELRCVQLTGTNDIIGEDTSCETTVIIPLSGEWAQYGVAASFSRSSEVDINENGVIELPNDQTSNSTTVTSFTTSRGSQAQLAVVKHNNLYRAAGYYMEGNIIYSFNVSHEKETVAVDLVKLVIESLSIQ